MMDKDGKLIIFEGYFCQSRSREESYGYSCYLCKFPPVNYRPSNSWDDWCKEDEILVPPEGTDYHDRVEDDDIISKLVPGKRYRVTIEEVEEEEGM